jgi:hypothetical protein
VKTRRYIFAYSLVELMISMGILALSGAGTYLVLRQGMILFAKNTAINFPHQQIRSGLLKLQQDLHTAVSIPQLVDVSGTAVGGTGPAAGVSFRKYAGGPFSVSVPAVSAGPVISSSSTQISIVTGKRGVAKDFHPVAGQRLHIQALPTRLVEADITAVGAPSPTGSDTEYNLTLASPIGTDLQMRNPADSSALNVSCFITAPVSYIVKNGRLVYTHDGITSTVASSVATAVPFGIPVINGSPNNSYVSVTKFWVRDSASSNLKFYAGSLYLNLQTPHWSQMATDY